MLFSFQTALKEKLASNPNIKFEIYDYVLETATKPFIVIGEETITPYNTKTTLAMDITTKINVWAQGKTMLPVKSTIDEIIKTLSDDLERDGYTYYFMGIQSIDISRQSPELILGNMEIKYRGRLITE